MADIQPFDAARLTDFNGSMPATGRFDTIKLAALIESLCVLFHSDFPNPFIDGGRS